MALSMLRARADTLRTTENEAKATEGLQSVTVVPLAIPLLAGPGAISTVHVWPEWASSAALLRGPARHRTPLSTLR